MSCEWPNVYIKLKEKVIVLTALRIRTLGNKYYSCETEFEYTYWKLKPKYPLIHLLIQCNKYLVTRG